MESNTELIDVGRVVPLLTFLKDLLSPNKQVKLDDPGECICRPDSRPNPLFDRVGQTRRLQFSGRSVVNHRAGILLVAKPGEYAARAATPVAWRWNPVVVQSFGDLEFPVALIDELIKDSPNDRASLRRPLCQRPTLVWDALVFDAVHDGRRFKRTRQLREEPPTGLKRLCHTIK